MNVNIIDEKNNPLFGRKEVILSVEMEVVPSKEESKGIVSEKFSCDKDLVRIEKVDSKFGVSVFNIFASIYDSKDEFDRIVKKTKQELKAEEEARKAAEEARKAEEEAKKAEEEAKKAEAEKPAEEVKEEKAE